MSQSITFLPRQLSMPTGSTQAVSSAAPFEIKVLSDEADLKQLFVLRRRAYEELLKAPPSGSDSASTEEYRDAFDAARTTVHIGAYDAGRLVGGFRLCFSQPGESLDALPCAKYYPALQHVKRQARGSLMEVSRFSIDTGITNTSYRTTLYASLVRTSLIAAEAGGVSTILVATRPEWVRFYTYMLGFDLIGEPALYPPGDIKIALLGGSLDQARKRQRMQNAFFRITPDEIDSMRSVLAPIMTRARAA